MRDSTSHRRPINPDQVTLLLRQIGTDLRLEDLTEDEFARFQALWDDLFRSLRRKKFGPVAVYKLCARKRPHLIPIYDTNVKKQLGTGDPEGFTAHLHRVFDIVVWREQEQRGKRT